MITEELFIKYITLVKNYDNAIDRLDEALFGNKCYSGLCESDWNINVGKMFDVFLESHFNEVTCGLIYWWMYENVEKIIHEKDGTKVSVEDIHDLWNYINKING